MGLWFLALKARKAGNWPRTFYKGLTVVTTYTMLTKYEVVGIYKQSLGYYYYYSSSVRYAVKNAIFKIFEACVHFLMFSLK